MSDFQTGSYCHSLRMIFPADYSNIIGEYLYRCPISFGAINTADIKCAAYMERPIRKTIERPMTMTSHSIE